MVATRPGDDPTPRAGEGGAYRKTPTQLASDPAFTGTYAPIAVMGGALCAVLGDSLANNGEGVAYWLAALSKQRFHFPSSAYIKSHPGYTSTQIATLTTEVTGLSPRPRFCLISVGSNDAATGVSAATFMANVATTVTALRAAGITPLILNVPPRGSVYGLIPEYNLNLFRFGAQNGIPVIDQYSVLADPATDLYLSAYDSGDHIHPSPAGCKAVASRIIADLAPSLPAAPDLTALAASGFNMHPGAAMTVDSNSDGIAEGFAATLSTGFTCSRVVDSAGFYWQRMTLSGATGQKTITGPTLARTVGSTTLAAGASAAATSLSLAASPSNIGGGFGGVFRLAGSNGTYEHIRVASISGSGPYTASLNGSSPLRFAHLSGAAISPGWAVGDRVALAVRVRSGQDAGALVAQATFYTAGQGSVVTNVILTSPNSTNGFTRAVADAVCYAEAVIPANTEMIQFSLQAGSTDGTYDFALPMVVNLTALGL